MSGDDSDQTIQKTQWTGSLLEDLFTALKGQRDDDTVRAFARELIYDKDLPIGYLVRKVKESVGAAEAERLDVLIRGRHVVERSKADKTRSEGLLRRLLRRFMG